jgi:hypothetical protein
MKPTLTDITQSAVNTIAAAMINANLRCACVIGTVPFRTFFFKKVSLVIAAPGPVG